MSTFYLEQSSSVFSFHPLCLPFRTWGIIGCTCAICLMNSFRTHICWCLCTGIFWLQYSLVSTSLKTDFPNFLLASGLVMDIVENGALVNSSDGSGNTDASAHASKGSPSVNGRHRPRQSLIKFTKSYGGIPNQKRVSTICAVWASVLYSWRSCIKKA